MPKKWTEEEDDKLRELWEKKLQSWEIGQELGRSTEAVQRRATRLKLGPRYTREERGALWWGSL